VSTTGIEKRIKGKMDGENIEQKNDRPKLVLDSNRVPLEFTKNMDIISFDKLLP
jgi:hypothetical protein